MPAATRAATSSEPASADCPVSMYAAVRPPSASASNPSASDSRARQLQLSAHHSGALVELGELDRLGDFERLERLDEDQQAQRRRDRERERHQRGRHGDHEQLESVAADPRAAVVDER